MRSGAMKVTEANADTLDLSESVTGDVPGRPSTSQRSRCEACIVSSSGCLAYASLIAYPTAVMVENVLGSGDDKRTGLAIPSAPAVLCGAPYRGNWFGL